MRLSRFHRAVLSALPLAICSTTAFGHLSYSNRILGTFSGLGEQTTTITGQTALNWSWADGTDGNFAHTHRLKFFRFSLENPAEITIQVASLDATNFLPGFSLYSGLAHASPPDYETALTFQYLGTLPGPAKEGAFNALGTWKMGNDSSVTYDDFSTFTYLGHIADGTASNFGPAAGVEGDGLADGVVSKSFFLPAGDYTLAVGGANYAGQGTGAPTVEGAQEGADLTAYGMNVTATAVPEPATALLAAGGLVLLGAMRRRRRE